WWDGSARRGAEQQRGLLRRNHHLPVSPLLRCIQRILRWARLSFHVAYLASWFSLEALACTRLHRFIFEKAYYRVDERTRLRFHRHVQLSLLRLYSCRYALRLRAPLVAAWKMARNTQAPINEQDYYGKHILT